MNTPLFLLVWFTCGALGVGIELYAIAVTPECEVHRADARETPILWLLVSILLTALGPFLLATHIARLLPKDPES